MCIGILLTVLLLGTTATALAAMRTEEINVTFRGISVVIDGELIIPRDAAGNVVEPFIWEGTTFLPVRAVADALGQEVDWDGSTSTVYLTTPQPPIIEVSFGHRGITDERLVEMVASGEIPADVTHLRLAVNSITDVSPLSSLTNLVSLDLWGNQVADVSPLGGLTGLTELILWGNNFPDISALYNLTNLTRLTIGDNLQFNADISYLRNFTNMTHLGLGGNGRGGISDFAPIGYLVELECLQLWGAGRLRELGFLENLGRLERLTINGADISDFSPIGELTSLTYLDLQSFPINDIASLRLGNLANLTELYLWNTQISDIALLSELTNLTRLGLGDNQITDISPLSGLTNLRLLWLHDNPLDESQIAELAAALPDCDIRIN